MKEMFTRFDRESLRDRRECAAEYAITRPMSASESTERVLDLPEMTPVILDLRAVERLFTDLAFETIVLEILLRAPDSQASGGSVAPNLRVAREAILSGGASGIQLRYLHAGVEWWDTLIRTKAGFRVVRVSQASRPSA
jgi:hypothetical protein